MATVSQGRFQVFYEKIRKEVEEIKKDNNYQNLSKAFAHWYLLNFENVVEEEIGEIIVDGDGDNGIDAMIIVNNTMSVFQFKFPDKVSNISKMQNETTALKLINGYKKLTSNRKPTKYNDNFMNFRERVKSENIFKYIFRFVSYSSELSENAKDAVETHFEEIKTITGNKFDYCVEEKKKICDKFERKHMRHNIKLDLKYAQMTQSYNLRTDVLSWSGFAKATDILSSCEEFMDIIFDENIRNYEGDNTVNQRIIDTASDAKESENFFFYHNGIVFICDKCDISTGNQVVSMDSAAIVNGCQSVVSLRKAKQSKKLKENVFLPVRIIETNDIDLRAKITEFLNSQTKIKDSYFLSNNPFIRELQDELKAKGYFLERLAKEYSYKCSLGKIDEYPKERIIPLEKAVQVYVVYTKNQNAAAAKRGKNEIFNKDIIDELIKDINASDIIESLTLYREIGKVITNYRKCRRTERNDSFLNYVGIYPTSREDYDEDMNDYLFMNTADLLLTNAYVNLENINDVSKDVKIKKAISICKHVILRNKKLIPSSATKNSSVFEEVQKEAQKCTCAD